MSQCTPALFKYMISLSMTCIIIIFSVLVQPQCEHTCSGFELKNWQTVHCDSIFGWDASKLKLEHGPP